MNERVVSVRADPEDIAELDRQWAEIEAGAPTVPHEKVARWLETWGTAEFKPWDASPSAPTPTTRSKRSGSSSW